MSDTKRTKRAKRHGYDWNNLDDRNARIMAQRRFQDYEHKLMMLEINDAWRERMWDTPDAAMCLGRYRG